MEILNRNARRNMTTRNRVPPFAFLCAVSILFWWHSLVMTLGLALANDAYTHILLILPLSAALIYLDSKHLFENRFETPGFEIRGFESAPNRSAAEPSHRSGAAGSGVADRWLCEVGDGCHGRRCPAVARHVCPRDLVDCRGPVLFWSKNFSVVSVSSLLSLLGGPHPRVRFELDRRIFATAVCGSGANHVSGGWGSGGAGWNHAVYSWTGHRSCTRVQQYSLQSNAGRHHHGFGSSFSALMVAESSARCWRRFRCLSQKTDFASSRLQSLELEWTLASSTGSSITMEGSFSLVLR